MRTVEDGIVIDKLNINYEKIIIKPCNVIVKHQYHIETIPKFDL